MHRDRGDQQRHGHRGGHEREHVHTTLEHIDRGKAVHERQREQEREEDLHPGLRDAQLLQQFREVTVRPLQWRLRTVLDVPRVVTHPRIRASDHGH